MAPRHQGGLPDDIQALPEIPPEAGYNTTSVGFEGNAGARGFDTYLEFAGWGNWAEGRNPKART